MHNRNQLHVKLYQIAGPRHVIRKTQKMLAVELAMSQFTLNRVMKEMVDDGRLKILGRGAHATKTYIVYEPVEWCDRRHDWGGAEYARSVLYPETSVLSTKRTQDPVLEEANEEGEDGENPDGEQAERIDLFINDQV